MFSLNDHHNEIVAFLEEVRGTTPEFSFIARGTDERRLLDTIIKNGSKRILQKDVAKDFTAKTVDVGRTIRKNLNRRLKQFSNKYEIKPPIRLYFNTEEEKGPGGHFACCRGLSSEESHSHDFIPLNELEDMIGRARQKLGLSTPADKDQNKALKQFRKRLKEEAETHLAEKLHYKSRKDYQSLGVEIGLIKKSNSKGESTG